MPWRARTAALPVLDSGDIARIGELRQSAIAFDFPVSSHDGACRLSPAMWAGSADLREATLPGRCRIRHDFIGA